MKKIYCHLYCIIVFLLGIGTIRAQEGTQIDWLTFEQLSDSLQRNPKKVLISFHTDWCVYCRKMHREVFTNPKIVEKIDASYYAVKFDAESTVPVRFDGQTFINRQASKQRNGYHDIALLLGARNGQFTVPVTLILDADFHVLERRFEYLHSRQLLKLL